MSGEATPAHHSRWRRGRRIAAITVLVVLVGIVIAIGWVSRPARLSGLILDRVGSSLGLQITAAGPSEYRLRGVPMLTVRGLTVIQPGASTPLLVADRVYLALPWATLWAGGDDLSIRRIELDGPRLNLQALQTWLATRPEGGPTRIPTLTDGARIVRGQLDAGDWSIDRINLSTDRLHAEKPLAARLSGRLLSGTTAAPFDLQIALTRPAVDAGVGIVGIATVRNGQSRVPLALRLSGVLRDGDGGAGLDAARVGATVRSFNDPSNTEPQLDLAAGLAGRVRYGENGLLIAPLGVALRGRDGMPKTIDASGSLALDDALSLNLQGDIGDWPSDWPALPTPLADSHSPFPFVLEYAGAPDFSGETHLQLRRDETRFDGYFRMPELSAWLDQLTSGTPLPPLRGTLETPRIEMAGTTFSGVRLELDDDDPPVAEAPQTSENAD